MIRRSLLLGAMGCLFCLAVAHGGPSTAPVIDFAAYLRLADQPTPPLLVDTRATDSYLNGHLPGAINLPGYLFDKNPVPGLPEDRKLTIVTYCSGGHCGISYYAAERLFDMGYQRVFVFEEGTEGWIARGQKLVTSRHEKLPRITAVQLALRLRDATPPQLVDARPTGEAATVPGAVSLTVESCRFGAAGMPPARDVPVVVFGGGAWDGRPYHVADRLRTMGYRQVELFVPGAPGWPRIGGAKP